MSSPIELRVNRRNTAAFIADKPVQIVLKPQRRVRTNTGGFETTNDPDRPAQTFRVIDISSSYMVSQPPQRTIDGVERSIEFVLLASYDAEMALYDTWADDQQVRWEITTVFPDNGYERRAVVVRYAD